MTLQDRMKALNALLAPSAVPIGGTLGRVYEEAPDETRFPFQRDRDRIIHSLAFRRLKGKTQVFVDGVGDHYRTRLTHTMEVAQISRDIARTLKLNEDLSECIALAHDLGHPPFGHAGEEALDAWMQEYGGSFEHNAQSLRIVTTLAKHTKNYPGLNLNQEVLEGLMKHRTPHDHPADTVTRSPSLEAQLVNIADEIAYTGHDSDDALRAGFFSIDDFISIPLIATVEERRRERGTSLRGGIIHYLVSDLYDETKKQLHKHAIHTIDDVYRCETNLVRFSSETQEHLTLLRSFLWEHMYEHPDVKRRAEEGQQMVTHLCHHLYAHPSAKIEALITTCDCSLHEAVKDYVAGMTDGYATTLTEKL